MSYDDDSDDDDGEIIVRPNEFPSLPFRDFNKEEIKMSAAYVSLAELYFFNEHRTMPKADIRKILQSHSFHLLPTYYAIAKGTLLNDKQIRVGDQVVTFTAPRELELFNPQSDLEFYQEYLFVEEKKLYDLEKEKSMQAHEALIEQQKSIGRKVVQCPICIEEFLWTEVIRCTNKTHFCCLGCLDLQINLRISNNNPSRGCFEPGCTGGIDLVDLRKALGKHMFAQFERAEKDKLLNLSNNKSISRCPECQYGLYFEKVPGSAAPASSSSSSFGDDDDHDMPPDDPNFLKYPVFDCPSCKSITCRRCRKHDHRGKLCPNEAEESEEALIRYVTNAMSAARIRHCPTCKTPAIKEEACNMITCKGCNHFYCYNCEWKIDDKDHYKHFGGVSEKGPKENGCPLYPKIAGEVNNKKTDELRVKKKAEEAIARWRAKHPRYVNINMAKLRKIIDDGL